MADFFLERGFGLPTRATNHSDATIISGNGIMNVAGDKEIRNFFDEFISSDMVVLGKPAPDTFLFSAKKLKVKPEECLVIEDAPNGILAAKNAGMRCMGFRHQFNKNMDFSNTDLIVESFENLSLNEIKNW